ncbi:hypothetical protein GCM10022226_43530 [Sphaerisporangium flaviroseum]|uniref:Uncharacterized protein n=1 Tax=Sphaerisporangium flaviroseum TaxID=509199 RepID=A0ABP7IH24_9ACTN
MSEPHKVDLMPREVTTARWVMWVQVALSLLALVLLGFALTSAIDLSGGGLLLLLGLGIVTTILLGVLAARYPSRRRWVRITAFVVEGLLILDWGYNVASDFTVTSLFNVILPVIVVILLSRPAASAWFDR